ncbi:MAG: carboxypeptidase regulatory-like domain-containing protein [Acidobacteria bacterium]|nr:carboxypeptidase regulatory-like domain-containing protein [Acidobacteriota bacterium]
MANFSISGRVSDGNGVGVGGVTVELGGASNEIAVTDLNGDYSFAGLPADGGFTVTPLGNGVSFSPESQTVDALTSNAGGLDFLQLAPTAALVSIGGRVVSPSGSGLKNVRVTIAGGSLAQPLTVVSNEFGYYRFEGIEAGATHIISVVPRRHAFAEPTRVVNAYDDIYDIDFRASP